MAPLSTSQISSGCAPSDLSDGLTLGYKPAQESAVDIVRSRLAFHESKINQSGIARCELDLSDLELCSD